MTNETFIYCSWMRWMLERVGQVILGLYVLKGRLSWFGFKYSALYLTTVWCNCNFGAFWRKISKIFGKVDRSAYFSTLFNLIERKNPGYIYTWIYENIAPEILPYVSFPCEIFLFMYWFFFFFLHFSFDPKSISRKHTLADIYKIKIVLFWLFC